jgi:hypothetical protein
LRSPAPVRHQRRGTCDRVGVFGSTQGATALDNGGARTRRTPRTWHAIRESGNRAAHTQKNDLKPWRRLMWCIGTLTREYRSRMYALLELYARPRSKAEPVICIDEKSMQLLNHSREALPMGSHSPVKQDYEYVRNGTCGPASRAALSVARWANAACCGAWNTGTGATSSRANSAGFIFCLPAWGLP